MIHCDAKQVLDFWFDEDIKAYWFVKSDEFDDKLRQRFLDVLIKACQAELDGWRESIEGRLAEIIVLDQFSRNIYRNSPKAFAQDNMALVLAQEAIKCSDFVNLHMDQRNFILMPFMHSESQDVHDKALAYFQAYASPNTLEFEYKHKAIIDRFGRYPHRNEILGRSSSADELAFLQESNSSF